MATWVRREWRASGWNYYIPEYGHHESTFCYRRREIFRRQRIQRRQMLTRKVWVR